jgi:hypothetical protein
MSRIIALVAAAIVAATILATPASARTSGLPSYRISGVETAIPQDGVSPFAGVAFSSRGSALWNARVPHESLAGCTSPGSTPCSQVLAGGSFTLSGLFVRIQGTFLSGGPIALVSGDPVGCTTPTAVYSVAGQVSLTKGGSGSATFAVVLTHYQLPLFGSCIPYFATVTGSFGP